MSECRCRECGRLLSTDASRAAGIGPTCAARSRVTCGHGVDARQVELFSGAYMFAPWLAEGFSAAQWPAVVASRARWAGSERHVVGCPGCEQFGVCAWHATGEVGREMPCGVTELDGAVTDCGNSNAPAGEIAEPPCPRSDPREDPMMDQGFATIRTPSRDAHPSRGRRRS